jgi:hypothetical protein
MGNLPYPITCTVHGSSKLSTGISCKKFNEPFLNDSRTQLLSGNLNNDLKWSKYAFFYCCVIILTKTMKYLNKYLLGAPK